MKNTTTIRPVSLRRRAIALIIAVILLSQTALAAPESLLVVSNGIAGYYQSFNHAIASGTFSLNFLPIDSVKAWLAKLGKKKQTLDRIVIRPTDADGTFTAMQDQKVVFSATAIADGQPTGGVDFKWTVQDAAQKHPARHLNSGVFQAKHPGIYVVTAAADNGQQSSITVTVNPDEGTGIRKLLSKKDEDRTEKEKQGIQALLSNGHLTTRSVSSKAVYNARTEKQIHEADKAKKAAARQIQDKKRQANPNPVSGETANNVGDTQPFRRGGPNPNDADAVPEHIGKRAMRRAADDDGWNGSDWYTADDPVNDTGSPAGAAPADGASNGDYQINAPVLSLAGRGIDVNLSLIYNARLWSKSGTLMSYDNDRGWPAPGWNLGFGKMMYMGGSAGCMIGTPDGTRRSFDGTNYVYSSGSYYYSSHTEHTTDGSFIDYSCSYSSSTYGQTLSGSASLPDGTTITYGSPSSAYDQVYPAQITDAQGNYINISYVGGQGPNIDTISDTLGRTITFNYDSSGRLINITAPGYGSTTRTLVRLHYTALSLSYAFASGYTTDLPGGSQYVLDSIYYPDTNTGYWFGDSDSYSSYGMIAKVTQQRGMSWSGSSGTQGTVTSGTMTDKKTYNFTLTPDSTLTDSPPYTTMTETWAGIDTSDPVTSYAVSSTSTDEVVTVTMPDGTVNKQTSHIDPGSGDDGFYYQGEIYASSTATTPLSKTKTFFGSGDYGTTRPTRVEKTDELSQTTATDFTYATSKFNTLITQKEYGYGGTTLYRQTNNTYETDVNYGYRHIFNLLKTTEVVDASSNRLTRTDYEHDNYTSNPLVATSGVVHHNDTSDPYTTDTHEETGGCLMWNFDGCEWEGEEMYIDNGGDFGYFANCDCQDWDTYEVSNYDYNSIYRGNVTKVTTYSDAGALTGSNGYDFTYDITGNKRTATTNCCQQMSFDYTTSTQFSQPETHTKGSSSTSSSLRMSEHAAYDFNTGAQISSTDFNGRTTTTDYDMVVRPTLVTMPTSAKTTTTYDDANLTETQTTKLSDNTTIVSETAQVRNGHGQPVLSKYLAGPSNWNATAAKYDAMGRNWKTSMPYDSAGSPSYWTELAYDALSRATQATAPDGSTSKTFYNETSRPDSASSYAGNTVRTQDAWGRERWARTDAFGRIVEVVEPKPDGDGAMTTAGTLATTYAYDELDQLLTVNQGSQTRSFKYDSLRRLTRQKLAEQTATINDSGIYVGAGGTGANWSDAFTYDARSNLTKRIDARGVETDYSYLIGGTATDPLNRLQAISYNTSSADATYTIDSAPSVAVSYMTTGDQTRVNQVSTSGVATEQNDYDTEGRISDYILTFSSRTSYPMETDYSYDTANRLVQITYPARYGMTSSPRHAVAPSYDQASRLTQMNVDSTTYLGNVGYNAAGQVTQLKVGGATSYPRIENYSYDAQTGLLTGQTVTNVSSSTTYMDVSYSYSRGGSLGTLSGKTGQMTQMVDNLDHNRDRKYESDALGRLAAAKGGLAAGASGITANWTQSYTYDRYGNKTAATASGVDQNSASIPADGLTSTGFNSASNRINDSGWAYDNAGNLIRGQDQGGTWQRFEYDAAGRLAKVRDDSGNVIETYTYGASRERLINEYSGGRTYYLWGGDSIRAEYNETTSGTAPNYNKSYIYADGRLFMTETKVSSTAETPELQHPDSLGTRLVTNGSSGSSFRQTTFPFGAVMSAETSGNTNQVFTSYDRSPGTGLDYADNRFYSKGQSRFTQVDPIGIGSLQYEDPQSLNLYSYVRNRPTDFVDVLGLYEACIHLVMTAFLGKLAGLNQDQINKISYFTGDGPGAADSDEFAATSASNIEKCLKGEGPSVTIHFPDSAQLWANIQNYPDYVKQGNYQQAGFMIHSIEDAYGAHKGFSNSWCEGHATSGVGVGQRGYPTYDPHKVDRTIGDSNFFEAANKVLQVMSGNSSRTLTKAERDALTKLIQNECGKFYPVEVAGGGGGGDGGGNVGYYGIPWYVYAAWAFADWVDSIPVGRQGQIA